MDVALSDGRRPRVDTARGFIAAELALLEYEIERAGVFASGTAQADNKEAKALGLCAMNGPQKFGPAAASVRLAAHANLDEAQARVAATAAL